jgi:hypothetical protein
VDLAARYISKRNDYGSKEAQAHPLPHQSQQKTAPEQEQLLPSSPAQKETKEKQPHPRTFERRHTQHYKYPRKTQHGSKKKQFKDVPKAIIEQVTLEATEAGDEVIIETQFGLEIEGTDIITILKT